MRTIAIKSAILYLDFYNAKILKMSKKTFGCLKTKSMIITDNKIKDLTYEELKDLIKSLYPIGLAQFIKYSRSSKSTLYKISKGKRWNEILEDCGLDLIMNKPHTYTKEDILMDIASFKERCEVDGIRFSSTSYRANGKYSQTIIDKVFGGWRNTLLELEKISSDSEEKEIVKSFILKYEAKCIADGVPFNSNTFKRGRPGIGYLKVIQVFGSWKSALEYCGLYDKYHSSDSVASINIGETVFVVDNVRISKENFLIKLDSYISNNNIDNIYQIYSAGYTKHNIIKAFKKIENFSKKYPNIKISTKSEAEDIIYFYLLENNIEFVKEFPGPVIGSSNSRFDFYIPSKNMLIEVHGIQHYELNKMFHKSFENFQDRVIIDNIKLNWAKSNGYTYIALPYDSVDKAMIDRVLNTNFEMSSD